MVVLFRQVWVRSNLNSSTVNISLSFQMSSNTIRRAFFTCQLAYNETSWVPHPCGERVNLPTQTLNTQKHTHTHKAHPRYCNQNGTALIIVLKVIIVLSGWHEVCRYCKTWKPLNCGLVLNTQQAAAASFQSCIRRLTFPQVCSQTHRPWTLPFPPRPRWCGDCRKVDARRWRGQWGKVMPRSEEVDPWTGCYRLCSSPI